MKMVISKTPCEFFCPSDFIDYLTDPYELEYPYDENDLYWDFSNHCVKEGNIKVEMETFEDWMNWWRKEGNIIDIVEKHYDELRTDYRVIDIPDNVPYRFVYRDDYEVLHMCIDNKIITSDEYEESKNKTIAPFQNENKYLEEPDR